MKGSRAHPEPTAGERIYAIGDIHGRYDLLKPLLALIAEDWANAPAPRRPVLVFCGDYVDRGQQSAHVLEALVWLQRRADMDVHALKGNHEQALMQFIDDPTDAAGWLRFGGAQTLMSYGVPPPESPDDAGACLAARDALLEKMPSSHLRLLERLELMLTIGDYAFVHAGVMPGRALADQAEDDLLWIRQPFLNNPGPFEKIIVHGHSWSDSRPVLLPHRIGLDTGAYATGVLTAVRLDGTDVQVLQAKGAPSQELWLH